MQLVKPALDVGLYTNDLDPMLTFWQQQAGITFTELLPVGGGVHQHRLRLQIDHAQPQRTRTPKAAMSQISAAPPTSHVGSTRRGASSSRSAPLASSSSSPHLRRCRKTMQLWVAIDQLAQRCVVP